MRVASFAMLLAALVSGASADDAKKNNSDPLCGDNSIVEPDSRILESDLTLQNALSASNLLPEFCSFDKKIEGECLFALMNRQRILEGYLKKQAVLEANDSDHAEALSEFCEFMKKAHYFD